MDYAEGRSPFGNQVCRYYNLPELPAKIIIVARSHSMQVKSEIFDARDGVLSVIYRKPGFNIILTGVPISRKLNFLAIKRDEVTDADGIGPRADS